MVKRVILLSMLLSTTGHGDPVGGLDGMAGSSTLADIRNWSAVTGSVQSVTNGYGSIGMISAAGSNSLWTAEYVSSDVFQTNAVYGMAVRAGNWSSDPGAGTAFTIAIGYYDTEWHELTNKTFTGGTAGEITPTTNGYYETLKFTNGPAISTNVAVRIGRTGTSGGWGGFDTVSLTILKNDFDGDGLPDQWEFDHGLNPNDNGAFNPGDGAWGDPDQDGLPNDEEYFLGSDPQVNESGRPWKPRPEKARLLVISAHPDDEGIFFGGAIPYYTQVRQLPAVVICMTSGVSHQKIHEAEFRDACWAYGLRNQPVFPNFYNNLWNATLDETWDSWADGIIDGDDIAEGQVFAAETLAYWIRRYRPDIVVTHDLEGEYGHPDHIASAIAATNALLLAADTNYVDGLQPWQVKKLYLHMYPTNQLFHDHWQDVSIDTNADSIADITPMDAANIGLAFHVYQGTPTNASTVYAVNECADSGWEPYPSEWWGLVSSTVGADTSTNFTAPDADNVETTYVGWARGDFFEHIAVFADSDYDQLPDDWELTWFPGLEAADPGDDPDADGLMNLSEYDAGTDPLDADTDHDGMPDGWEVGFALDPLTTNALSDADSDGRTDLYEFAMGGDPANGLDEGIAPSYTVVQSGGTNYLDFIHARRTNAVELGLNYWLELTDDQMSGTWTNGGYAVTGLADMGNGFESVTNRLAVWGSSNIYLRVAVSTSNATVYSAVTGITALDLWAGGYGLYGTNAVPAADPDGDGLDNAAEFSAGTHPTLSDTDGDGLSDYSEIHNVIAWGDNYYRQTVVPFNVLHAIRIAAGGSHGLALLADGKIVGWGDNYYSQYDIPASVTNVVSIAAGEAHSLASLSNKTVVAWGDNYYHQCDVPASATNIVAVAGGLGYSLALQADGHVVAWGSNNQGELDVPLSVTNAVKIAAGNYHSLALLDDGQVIAWGDNSDGACDVPALPTNAVAVAAGGGHSLALLSDGHVVAWGQNDFGQASVPANINNAVAVAAGGYHSLAVLADGSLVGWGNPFYGIGTVPPGAKFSRAVAAGRFFSMALKNPSDPLDPDSDNDGLSDGDEANTLFTDPLDADSDHDGMPDGWEVGFALDPLTTNALSDADSDGRTDLYEFAMRGDPANGLDEGIAPSYTVVQSGGTNYLDFIHARRTNAVELGLNYWLELTDDQMSGTWTNGGYAVTGMADLSNGFESVTNRLAVWGSSNIFLRVAVSTSNATVYSAVTGITALDLWAGGYGLYGTNAVSTADPDGDGLDNAVEFSAGTHPTSTDTDADGMPDGWEVSVGLNPISDDAALDLDSDGLSNLSEYGLGTDLLDADTDNDGMPDGWEVGFALDPLTTNALSDADSDGRTDLYEFAMGGDPANGLDEGIAPSYTVVQSGGTNYLDFIHARRTNAVELGLSYRLELTDNQMSGTWTNGGYAVTGLADMGNGFESVTNRLAVWGSSNIYLRVAVSTSNATVYSAVTGITAMDLWAGNYGLYGTNAVSTADPDGDGLDNAAEFSADTNPAMSDTDGDTFNDGLEVTNGGNPLMSDLWRVDYIRNHGADYNLYSSNAVLDISIGQAVFAVSGGTAWLSLQLEESRDLVTWTNAGDEVIWSIPVDTSNAFYRVRSGR